MQALRSAGVHHIDYDPWSFLRNGENLMDGSPSWSLGPYHRPQYDVFQRHCQMAMNDVDLMSSFRQAEVHSLRLTPEGFSVETCLEEFRAERVILSTGPTEPWLPEWACRASKRGERVAHVLQRCPLPEGGGDTVVVGDGMSGVQYAIALAKSRSTRVTLLGRQPLRLADFDADPCWLGPKCLNEQFSEASFQSRREQIAQARYKGTVTPEVLAEWKSLRIARSLEHHLGETSDFRDGHIFTTDGRRFPADSVILATGFEKGLPGGKLIKQMINELDLPLSPCGFPILTEQLEWSPGLYVSGGLAEMVVGPVARNIAGARLASKRILGRTSQPLSSHLKNKGVHHASAR